MANTKPFVQTALLCEKVIQEGPVLTLIRVVDTFTVQVPENLPDTTTYAIDLNLVVTVKAGDLTGPAEMSIQLRPPDKPPKPPQKWPVNLQGGVNGANFVGKIQLVKPSFGLYWFDVFFNEELLTSVPFRVLQREDAGSTQTTAGAQAEA